jgi:peroxisomal membrane protein 4
MLKSILRATYSHARNLGMFVPLYKTLLYVLSALKGGENSFDAFVAGAVGGWVVFGASNSINQQINLYLFSRVCLGLAKMVKVSNLGLSV